MPPFSEHVIFLDTEFTDLNIRKGELLSIGMVTYAGKEFYAELSYTGEAHPWVKKHVLPSLQGFPLTKKEVQQRCCKFIGKEKPYMVAYVNQFDAVFWYDLFDGPKEHPFYWIPIDFASMLFAYGYDPNSLGKDIFFSELGLDKKHYTLHNALDDAKMLRDVYIALHDRQKNNT